MRRSVDALRAEVAAQGRDPRAVTVYALLTPVVGATDDDARARFEDFHRHASRDGALALFSGWTGVDLSGLDPDQPLQYVENDSTRSALAAFTVADPDRRWTVADVLDFVAVGGRGPVVTGSATTVADEIERWADEADVDGFNIAAAVTPGTFVDFVDGVVPELQRRGRVQTGYAGTTLRENVTGGGPRLGPDHTGSRYRRTTSA